MRTASPLSRAYVAGKVPRFPVGGGKGKGPRRFSATVHTGKGAGKLPKSKPSASGIDPATLKYISDNMPVVLSRLPEEQVRLIEMWFSMCRMYVSDGQPHGLTKVAKAFLRPFKDRYRELGVKPSGRGKQFWGIYARKGTRRLQKTAGPPPVIPITAAAAPAAGPDHAAVFQDLVDLQKQQVAILEKLIASSSPQAGGFGSVFDSDSDSGQDQEEGSEEGPEAGDEDHDSEDAAEDEEEEAASGNDDEDEDVVEIDEDEVEIDEGEEDEAETDDEAEEAASDEDGDESHGEDVDGDDEDDEYDDDDDKSDEADHRYAGDGPDADWSPETEPQSPLDDEIARGGYDGVLRQVTAGKFTS